MTPHDGAADQAAAVTAFYRAAFWFCLGALFADAASVVTGWGGNGLLVLPIDALGVALAAALCRSGRAT